MLIEVLVAGVGALPLGMGEGVVAKATLSDGEVVLLGKQGRCPDGDAEAIARDEDGKEQRGCWFFHDGVVWVSWVDGRHSVLPPGIFKRPATV
jgi:hypothetical protein